MSTTLPPANTIAAVAHSLADFKSLPLPDQSILLLKRLALLFPQGQTFSKQNFLSFGPNNLPDPYGITSGYPREIVPEMLRYLLSLPWHYLEQNYLIAQIPAHNGFFELTPHGFEATKGPRTIFSPDRVVVDALALLHSDLRGYGHYFRERKLKEAVAAGFKRVENRLNEIRDRSTSLANPGASGVSLPHELFRSGDLRFPFPLLSASNAKGQEAYAGQLKNFLSSGIGWFRNSFDHEPHNIPELTEAQALEQLFIASYMLRILETSTS